MAIPLHGTCTSPSCASGTPVVTYSCIDRCERLGSCHRGLDKPGTNLRCEKRHVNPPNKTGSCSRRTPCAVLIFSSRPTVSPRAGTVPRAFVARFAHSPASGVESELIHCQREPQPGSHRAYKGGATPEPGRPVTDRRRCVYPRTPHATRRSPMARRSAETS